MTNQAHQPSKALRGAFLEGMSRIAAEGKVRRDTDTGPCRPFPVVVDAVRDELEQRLRIQERLRLLEERR